MEYDFEKIGYGTGFQLHLFKSAFYIDRVCCTAWRTVYCNLAHGCDVDIRWSVLRGKKIERGINTKNVINFISLLLKNL